MNTSSEVSESFGRGIHRAIARHGKSKSELAQLAGVDKSVIEQITAGEGYLLPRATLEQVTAACPLWLKEQLDPLLNLMKPQMN